MMLVLGCVAIVAQLRPRVLGSMAPDPPCADDPTYRNENGLDNDGKRAAWACADWKNFVCSAGGLSSHRGNDARLASLPNFSSSLSGA